MALAGGRAERFLPPVTVGLSAGGSQLSAHKGPSAFYYLETVSVTAVTAVAFDKPDRPGPRHRAGVARRRDRDLRGQF